MTEHDTPQGIVSADVATKAANTAKESLGFWGL